MQYKFEHLRKFLEERVFFSEAFLNKSGKDHNERANALKIYKDCQVSLIELSIAEICLKHNDVDRGDFQIAIEHIQEKTMPFILSVMIKIAKEIDAVRALPEGDYEKKDTTDRLNDLDEMCTTTIIQTKNILKEFHFNVKK